MLIIPCIGRERQWEDAIAIEVKAYRLARTNRNKSPGDSGRAQTAGLVEMGFPLVGLLHVVPVEAGDDDEFALLPVWPTNTPLAINQEPTDYRRVDLSGMTFSRRQSGRLQKLELPDCVGAKVLWLTLGQDGGIEGTSIGEERAMQRNPTASGSLAKCLPEAVKGLEGLRCGYPPRKFRAKSIPPSGR